MEPVIMYFLFLSNCGFIVRGFSLRSCYLLDEKAVCSHHQLTEVPTDIPPFVKSIDLSNNNISRIQLSDFTHFPNLTALDLNQNSISNIGRRTFSKLVPLKRLVLSRNQLVQLEDDVFDGLSKLLELKMGWNHIEKVAPNAFRSLRSLKVLDLSNNKLRTVAEVNLVIRHMPKLANLMIANNSIVSSKDLTNVSTIIKFLDVSENPLERFEVTTDIFPRLKKLNIGNPTVNTNLTWAVQNSSLLCQVKYLDISAVQLASIDEWRKLFSTLHSLYFLIINPMQHNSELINISCSILKLSGLQTRTNTLTSIKTNLFQKCQKVSKIDLNGNSITHIENGSFEFLHYLHILSLSNNRLISVPTDFVGLTSLKQLDLQWNNVTALKKCTFVGLSKLEILNLQGNSISELGNAFQSSLPNLKVLQLNQNKLTIIRKREFSGLRSLTNISLDQNQIKLWRRALQMNELRKDALHTVCFNDLGKLRKLNLDNNHIKYVDCSPLEEPPFMNLSSLETLQISIQRTAGRSCFPSNFLLGLSSLLTFSCNNIQLLNFSDVFFTPTPHLNDLLDVSSNVFTQIPYLTRLRISSTNLHSLDFLINANLTKLKILQAKKNGFSVISEDIVRSVPSLIFLDVTQNGFSCDCDNSWFVKWIKNNSQTQVADAYSFECNYPSESKGKKLLDLNVQSCVVDISFICFISSTCVNIVILVASFTFHFSRFQLTYAYYIFLAWLYDSRNRQKRAACRYDAFVSYNSHDEAWVYRELVPHLEQDQGWRLCLHHRDFLPGKPIVENIAEAIYGSRKTICVVSRRYLQSEWCSKEMQLASFRLFDEREDVLILVFLEDIPSSHLSPYYRMKRLLKRRSYLSWPRAAQHPQLFWEKLRQALRSTTTEEEDRLEPQKGLFYLDVFICK
uniref:TIR domain-containing protein n=1 Tax=Neogobius melanostomus TaxID=47308 RepID=A0A8C6UE25_9GOBI